MTELRRSCHFYNLLIILVIYWIQTEKRFPYNNNHNNTSFFIYIYILSLVNQKKKIIFGQFLTISS